LWEYSATSSLASWRIGGAGSRLGSIVLPLTADLWQATGVMALRSLGINVAMPAGRALRADLVPAKIRGKLFGKFNAFFDVGMIAGVLLGPWLFDAFRHQQFEIKPLNLTVSGVGTPFFINRKGKANLKQSTCKILRNNLLP